jgi:hypothetical protein
MKMSLSRLGNKAGPSRYIWCRKGPRKLPRPEWLIRVRRAQEARTIAALEPGVEKWLRERILQTTIDMERTLGRMFAKRAVQRYCALDAEL